MKIPVTVFTGSLGAGKTTIILNLIKQLPKDYKVVWLKNEYGDVNVDAQLARENNIQTTEILNGCLCCVLIGKLEDALKEITEKYNPARIIIETAGTAYPFPIIHEISEIEKLKADGVINVVDALNFERFRDRSVLARKQGKFIDLIIINKVELTDPETFEKVEDDVFDIYPENQKVKSVNGFVDKDLIFGLDHKLLNIDSDEYIHHHDEDIQTFSFTDDSNIFDIKYILDILNDLDPVDFYRIKGIIKTDLGYKLVNYVLGKIDVTDLKKYSGSTKINFIGRDIKVFEEETMDKLKMSQVIPLGKG